MPPKNDPAAGGKAAMGQSEETAAVGCVFISRAVKKDSRAKLGHPLRAVPGLFQVHCTLQAGTAPGGASLPSTR